MASVAEVGHLALEQAGAALEVLVELMGDQHQAGPVRVAAAKGVIDYALKLSEQSQQDTFERLDQLLGEVRQQCDEEDQGD